MFYSNTLNLIQVGGGTQVKQGDLGSKFSYKLANEKDQELDDFDKEVAHIDLVLDDKIVFTTTATVDNSTVTFNIDKAIPVGLYFLEIKIRDYIFPSDKQTIIFVQSGAVAYDLKELVPNYDTNMEIAGILSDLSQKGIDISDLKRQLAQKANKDEVTNVMTPKGTLAYASLPTSGNQVGWYYYCPDGDGTHGAGNYVWNGTSWYFGGTGDEGYNLLKKDLKKDLETKADNAEFNATLEELTAEVMYSRNVFDDSEYVGDTMPDYTQVNKKNFYGDFKYLKVGTDYFVQVEYTDGTKGNVQLVWCYIYADDTKSSLKSLGSSNIAEKDVKCFSIERTTGYTNTDDGKQIAHVWMTSGSNVYEPHKVSVKSKRLENIENDVSNAMISTDYMNQKNLLTDDNITDNLQIQPYTTVTNENYCSAYIPVKTGQTLYANYPLGTFVAWLCKADKTKISWVTINYSNEGASRNTGYTVETEDVEYIRLYWNKTRSGHHAYGTSTFDLFFSTEPIRFKCADKQFDESYIPEFNTGRLNNWWYLKSGDSLGDSLTGQGFFQSWTKRYFGLNSFANHGVGGSKLSGADTDSTRPSMWKDERINALSTTADFITVLGGQNDGNVAIGDISKSNYDTDTYVGALNTIIDKIYDHCKQGVIIILCTPFYVPAEGDDGERFNTLGNAVREIGNIRGIPVADFGGLCTADKKTADLYWGTDRTHPNENFYRDKIAPILISTMESIKPIDWENVNYYE